MEFEIIALPDGKKILTYVWNGQIVCWLPLKGLETRLTVVPELLDL